MRRNIRPLLVPLLAAGALLTAAACGSSSPAASSTAAESDSTSSAALATSSSGGVTSQDIFDRRYCEVVPITTSGDTTTQLIYNTLGLNNCPQEQWSQLTPEIAAQEFGSQSAELNGPRHWVLDNIVQLTPPQPPTDVPQTFTFGGIETSVRAELQVPSGTAAVGTQPYSPNPVQRDTVWVYNSGRSVYQLTDPDGNVYVMQSYSQQQDPDLDLRKLDDLGSELTMPAGWSFSAEKLSDQLNLISGGTAYVIQDELLNTYQSRSNKDTSGADGVPTAAPATASPATSAPG